MYFKKITFITILVILISGCAWWKNKTVPSSNPETLYEQGYKDYQKGRYEKAIESFQKLKEEYPLSELAIRAELGIADAHFSMEEYGYAENAYSSFANLHPANEYLPYVIYQVGMCNYKQMLSIDRDQTATRNALNEFEKLSSRFPSSKFSVLAGKNIRDCKSMLAEHEFYVGELYFKMKQYKAAMRRFENILKNYAHLGLDKKVQLIMAETRKQLAEKKDKVKIQ